MALLLVIGLTSTRSQYQVSETNAQLARAEALYARSANTFGLVAQLQSHVLNHLFTDDPGFLDASQVATFSNVAPVLTVIWGIWFFHERLTLALLIVSLFLLVFVNLENAADNWSERVQVTVYFDHELTQQEQSAFRSKIGSIPGTARVGYVSRDEALKRFKGRLRGQETLLDGVRSEVLPTSLGCETIVVS